MIPQSVYFWGNVIAIWVNLTQEILGLSSRCYHVADLVILPSSLKRPTQDKLSRLLSKKHSLYSTNVQAVPTMSCRVCLGSEHIGEGDSHSLQGAPPQEWEADIMAIRKDGKCSGKTLWAMGA